MRARVKRLVAPFLADEERFLAACAVGSIVVYWVAAFSFAEAYDHLTPAWFGQTLACYVIGGAIGFAAGWLRRLL